MSSKKPRGGGGDESHPDAAMAVQPVQHAVMLAPEQSTPIIVGMAPTPPKKDEKPKMVIVINYENKRVELPAYIAPLALLAIFLMMLINPWFTIVILPLVIALLVGMGVGNIVLDREQNTPELGDSISIEEE